MESFSQQYGYKPVKTVVQVDGIDQDLRNGLWNALDTHYWWQAERRSHTIEGISGLYRLGLTLWQDYFKKPLDTMPSETQAFKQEIRAYYFNCQWFEVYDFIQFVAKHYFDDTVNAEFVNYCNDVLKREISGYRFIGTTITPITREEEIAEIEEVLRSTDFLEPVIVHLNSALDLFSDRESPDYRNSIKESISAVEAMCRLIAGSNATLGKALGEIQRQGTIDLHSALKEAFNKLYGYTSDKDGIRHSLLEQPNLDFEDAKFMLVSCSAFINYLKVKSDKAGIKLEKK